MTKDSRSNKNIHCYRFNGLSPLHSNYIMKVDQLVGTRLLQLTESLWKIS